MAEPESVSAEAVLRELRLFELCCEDPEGADRLVELCLSHGLGAADLANELLAFITSRDLPPTLGPHTLDTFQHEVLAKRSLRAPPKQDRARGGSQAVPYPSLQGLTEQEAEDELLDAYSPPCKAPQRRSQACPGTPRAQRDPQGLLGPGSISPRPCPSPLYSSRPARGQLVASFGSWEPSCRGRGRGATPPSCTPKLFGAPEENLTKSYKFMFQKALEVQQALSEQLLELGEALRSLHGLGHFGCLTAPAQEARALLGRVAAAGGRLRLGSVLLEGPPPAWGSAPLDLSLLQDFCLYPGQVVALEGTNPSGRCVVVSKIYEGAPLPFYQPPEQQEASEPLLVVVASGPFSPSDGLGYDPLGDLLEVLRQEPPDVCVLFGPFLDASHEQVESCQLQASFRDLFRLCLRTILEATRSGGCQLVLVPSAQDVPHDSVFPQPPFPCPELPPEDRARLLLVPDPCTLELGGAVLGLTASDVLLHLGAEELCRSSVPSDRFTRVLKHILTQRSYYPLYPPSEELNVDLPRLAAFGRLPVTPHVLVTPSRLRFFIKEVLGCVCINPGRLTQGQAGGTFGRLCLQRAAAGTGHNPCRAAQVLRI